MRKHRSLVLLVVCYAALAAYAGWVFYKGSGPDGGWSGLHHAWPYLLAGVLTVGGVIGLFVWLAFFSERRGYDERARTDKR
jgi:hypothetical protein